MQKSLEYIPGFLAQIEHLLFPKSLLKAGDIVPHKILETFLFKHLFILIYILLRIKERFSNNNFINRFYSNLSMTNNDAIPELTTKEFEEFTKKGLVFIDFFAEWCMPCLMMAPVIDELSERLSNKIKFGKVNVGDNKALARKFNVSSIPNFVLLKDGKPIEQFVGAVSGEELEKRLEKFY